MITIQSHNNRPAASRRYMERSERRRKDDELQYTMSVKKKEG
jgi:hypothetical protein